MFFEKYKCQGGGNW